MQLDEALARLVKRHALLHATTILLALAGIALVITSQKPSYEARGRVLLTAQPASSSQEAESIAARARAAVTSEAMMRKALGDLPVSRREVRRLQGEVQLEQLGTSTAADVVVTDRDPRLAGQLADSLVRQIVAFNNQLELGRVDQAVADIDRQLKDLQSQSDRLSAQDSAAGHPDASRTRREAAITQLVQQLTQDRSRLVVGQQLTASATVIDDAPALGVRAPSHTVQYAALLVLAALTAGALAAGLLEALRPSVPGVRYAARALDTPLLPGGSTRDGVAHPVAARLVLSARQSGSHTLVLVGPLPSPRLRVMAERLEASLESLGHRSTAFTAGAMDLAHTPLPAPANGSAAANGAAAANATAVALHQALRNGTATAPAGPALRVLVAESASLPGATAPAIVAVLPRRALRRDVEDVRDLAAATGWPVLGVLPAPATRKRLSLWHRKEVR